ncbi:MAG: hypothetical protein CSB24_07260 [Deltaproteobacteria bacterium]|nr:MAG: hypothetical protein CSB24_07260 [Deltaproteobacteria bacterium]
MIKNLVEAALEAELDSHLARKLTANRRNGKSRKTIKSLNGNFELTTPRDGDGTFTPFKPGEVVEMSVKPRFFNGQFSGLVEA